MYYYCSCDVDILRKGCVKFSQLFNECANITPFYDSSCITISEFSFENFSF